VAYRRQEIGQLVTLDPIQARERVLDALRGAGMHRRAAAEALGCTVQTLLRWIEALGLGREVARLSVLAARDGWHHGRTGGRPAKVAS
jgi:transposase